MYKQWTLRSAMSWRVSMGMAFALVLSACGSTIGANVAGTATSSSVTPTDQVSFAASSFTVTQAGGSASLSVTRSGAIASTVSVSFATADGTAVAGSDYTATSGTLTWAANDGSAQTITVPISNANPFVGSKSFQVTLSTPTGDGVIASPSTATVTISGDGSTASAGTLQFSAATYTVSQGSGTAAVTVSRAGGSAGAISVAYATSNGTAVGGTDFTTTGGTLNWAAGDTSSKSFSVPVSNASPFTGSKSFTVTLSSPTGTAALGTTSSASVVIDGDASVATIEFSASSYATLQTAGTVTITVNRAGGSSAAVGVTYATADGTATAGTTYTAASGTLNWAVGDTTSKTFEVSISNATPFSGNKSFGVALSDAAGGATLGSQSTATVNITGSSSVSTNSGGPSAVTNLQVINQGGPRNQANGGYDSLTNYQKISWNAATPGAKPIASYNIYRNGVLYANTTALSYADTAATNSNSPTWVLPATIYSYNVAAVDTTGVVGPLAAQMSLYGYQNGVSNWGNADLSYGGATANYSSTAGNPQGGKYDIAVDIPGSGGFLPVSDAPQAPTWDLELGAFNYFVIDFNPGNTTNYIPQMNIRTRVPPGDIYGWVPWVNIFDYGPAPQPNTWATYKIPLTVYNMGIGHFTGSISGTTLTVTAVGSGVVDAGGFVTGPGVPQGTYVVGFGQHGSIGTFTVAGPGINGSTSVPSTQLTWQRTAMYKFGIQPNTGTETFYINNVGFTVN